jgi:N-acetylneuraminate synthase
MACDLIDAAAKSGANAVKFQTFRAAEVISLNAPKAAYQRINTKRDETQLEMVRRLELSSEVHTILVERARSTGIDFLSTPFDLPSLRLLTRRLGLKTIKIPSGEITNGPFLLEIVRTGSKVILSTGMSTLGEVETALGVLAFGYLNPLHQEPSLEAFARAFCTDIGQQALRENVTLLHCATEYPAPYEDVNLKAMNTLTSAFGLPVGLSDHTLGIHIAVAAVSLGAIMIEKHLTLDKTLPGPDHAASLEPKELKSMVQAIRDVECALGDGIKRPKESELENRNVARKSLVAGAAIEAGDSFTSENLAIKRPGSGMSPMRFWESLKRQADRNYDFDELLNQ